VEELIGFVGFSLGASLGAGLTRALGEGTRPFAREALKVGIRLWDATGRASAAVRQEAASVEAGTAPTGRGRRRRAEPQKIAIARS
jgi:hypothetical protein